jgi:hypothetical protein
MSGAYTDYPVSPLASLAKLIATGYKLYNYSQTQKQDELERQRKEQEARIEAERQAREYDQTQAAQALQMGQWAQTGQGWQMLQQPEYQEQFRRAGGVLPIQSQQMQGQGVNPGGPMPLSALSNAKVQNTYKLPEKPQELFTLAEFYKARGHEMPQEYAALGNSTVPEATKTGWKYETPDQYNKRKDAERMSGAVKWMDVLSSPEFKAFVDADPSLGGLAIRMGAPTRQEVVNGQELSGLAWNLPKPEAVPWEDQPFTGEAPPQFKGITNGQAVKLGILKAPEEPKTLTRAETPVNKLYTPEQLQQMGVPQILWDQPTGKAIEASPVLAEAEGFKPQTPDNTKAFQDAREDLDDLNNKLASAVADGDEVNAVRYWGMLQARLKRYAGEMPDLTELYPLDKVDAVRQNAKAVKTEKAQTKISADAGEILQRKKVAAIEKLDAGKDLLPGERVLVYGDEQSLYSRAVTLAQNDPAIAQLAIKAEYGLDKKAEVAYNTALDKAIDRYLVRLQSDERGPQPAPAPKPNPQSKPTNAQQNGLLKGTKSAPAGKKDTRTPAEKQKRTEAVRQIIGQAKAAIGAKKYTKAEVLKMLDAEAQWYDAAELDWFRREINKMK